MKKKHLKSIAIALTLSFFTLSLQNITTYASEKTDNNSINQLIEKNTKMENVSKDTKSSKESIAISKGNSYVIEVPKNPSLPIKFKAEKKSDNFTINLPKEVNGSKVYKNKNGNIIYINENKDNSFGNQLIEENGIKGVRSLITINNSNAPKTYKYKFNLENGSKLISDSDYLGEEFSSGEIFVVNKDNIITGIIDKPWAYDANGKEIDTHYEIENDSLIQVINFKSTDKFPIVADPSAWQITKCAASIVWLIGSTVFVGAKLLKIKRYIKALGGVKTAAQLLMTATTTEEKLKVGGSALVKLAEEILGIAAVQENCVA